MVKGQTGKSQNSSIDQPWCQSHFTFTFDSINYSSTPFCCKLSLKDPQGMNSYILTYYGRILCQLISCSEEKPIAKDQLKLLETRAYALRFCIAVK